MIEHSDADFMAVPEYPQLLERLDAFDRRRCQPAVFTQEAGPIAVDADVAQRA